MKSNPVVLLLLCLFLVSCSPTEPPKQKEISPQMTRFRSVFQNAESIILYRLEPDRVSEKAEGQALFRDYPILKQATVAAPESQAIMQQFWTGYAPDGSAYFCFNPRHGISTKQGDVSYDLVICFECGQVQAYLDGGYVDGWIWQGTGEPLNKALQWDSKSAGG